MGNVKLFSGKGRKQATSKGAVNKGGTTTAAQTKKASVAASNRSNGSAAASYTKKTKKVKRVTGLKVVLVIVLILIAGAAAAAVALGVYVDKLDTVYPNVWADGIELAGLTVDEANLVLIEKGYEGNAKDVSATVKFPDGSSFVVTGDEAGFSLDAQQAAIVAYEYGRGGTFFQKELAFIKAYFNKTDLRNVSSASLDEEYVRNIAAEHTKIFNSTLIDGAYDIKPDRIIVVKGAGIRSAIEDDVIKLTLETLNRALEENTSLTADYSPGTVATDDVDLEMLLNTIKKDPVDACFDLETFDVIEGSDGLTFNISHAKTSLDRAVSGDRIEIPLVTLRPLVNAADLEEMLYRDVLAERTTKIAGTSNRLNNIILASAAVDGTILLPGDVFSFNDIVGMRTAEKGYREAGAYISGNVVLETGGGICQTSSTIYDVVLQSNLEVVERRPHMFTVAYLPFGNDATVNWGTIDFKFKNSSDYPLRIDAKIDGRDLTVQFIGTKLDENYTKIEYKLISTTAFEIIREEDETVPQGTTVVKTDGHTGYVVDTYKYIYDKNDNLLEEVYVGRSTYRTQNRLILIPPEIPPEEEPTEGGLEGQDPDNPDNPDSLNDPSDLETGEEQPGDTESPDTEQPGDTPPTDTPSTDTPPSDGEPTEAPLTDTETPDTQPPGNQPNETTSPGN